MITVRELMTVTGWGTDAVLAGEAFLDKELIAVTSFDSPDGHRWLHEGEFVLTTGYPFVCDKETSEERLIQLIEELCEIGTPGFAIKLGRYIDELPFSVIHYANQKQMPILSFPMDKAWSDIIIPIAHYINAKQREELDRTHAIYESFHRHLTSGGSVEKLAALLHEVLQTPVSIFSSTLKWNLHIPMPFEPPLPFEDLWASRSSAPGDHGLIRYHQKHAVRWLTHHHNREGAIVLWEMARKLHSWEKVALEQAAALLTLEIERHYTVLAAYQRFRNDFLHLLVTEKNAEPELLIRKADEVGWKLGEHYVAAVMKHRAESESDLLAWRAYESLLNVLRTHWEKAEHPILCGLDRENRIVLLFPVQTHAPSSATKQLSSLPTLMEKARTQPMCIGIGRFHPGLSGVATSYREAVISCRAARQADPCGTVTTPSPLLSIRHFSALGLERVLFAERPEEEARLITEECLGELIRYDQEKSGQLVETLRTFLACDGNHADAAAKLFVHKNTVKYRLQVISDLTGLQPENGQAQLLFRIALTSHAIRV
ncbi:helix-turn-helix domain-containing protein [Brevibacillus ruminantium]|uniref:Helix-turn-helix domain-containing protein n=1 Tax=Brevibacillus ruminantium TaxID=2950604 RepID=A0ABY4W8B2_9BACL|nr:PucR family transcriptional regulator [Brevibacillus ruminantium]USG63426.1 helix-turn-helix domain-containing protein [Brevibacillus ruminantium]